MSDLRAAAALPKLLPAADHGFAAATVSACSAVSAFQHSTAVPASPAVPAQHVCHGPALHAAVRAGDALLSRAGPLRYTLTLS